MLSIFVVIVALPVSSSVAVATGRLLSVFIISTFQPFTGIAVFSSTTCTLIVVLSMVLFVTVAVVVEFNSTTSTLTVLVAFAYTISPL